MEGADEITWIAFKAGEFLEDKARDSPLTKKDVEMAFDIFARPRLQKLRLQGNFERRQVEDQIIAKLEEKARRLNSEQWGKDGL